MYLLINNEYGQEIAAVQYDEEKEKLKDVFDAARVKYPHNAFCVCRRLLLCQSPPRRN